MQKDRQKNEEEIKEELDFNKPDYAFIPNGVHMWRQEGYYLVCHSCDLTHAVFIGKDKVMVGEDEKGSPILKTRKELKMV